MAMKIEDSLIKFILLHAFAAEDKCMPLQQK
jgi:hypothetical protein